MTEPPSERLSLALLATAVEDIPQAAELAGQLGIPLAPPGTEPADCVDFDVLLLLSDQGLALQQTRRLVTGDPEGALKSPRRRSRAPLPGPVTVDFGSDEMRYRRRSGHNELLGKAVGVSTKRQLHVLDATAGLGRDSFVLADMGCAVSLCERDLVVAAMLARGLEVAQAGSDGWLLQVVERMSLYGADARTLAPAALSSVDVIYLDPMFPLREKSAAVKKEMALFQALLDGSSNPGDPEELLGWARAQDVARVVVKRPGRAPFLGEQKPSHSVAGKAVRFDVYVRRSLSAGIIPDFPPNR